MANQTKGGTMSGKFSKLVLMAFVGIWFLNCAHKNGTPMERTSDLQKVYVDPVEPQQVVAATDQLKVTVQGNLPSPAYKFERFDVTVKKDVIEITPLAQHDPDKVVIQVLVRFAQVCEVKNLKPGIYQIKVNGRGDQVVAREKIEIKK